jgi:hypothetical protein
MKKSNTSIAKSLKKAGFYDAGKKQSERLNIINNVTTKPQRVKMVDKLFIDKKFKDGGPSLAVGRGEKLSTEKGAGLTAKGRAKYNAATGSNLKAPQPQGGARKDSFCARMSGMPGPMKDEKGKPTRKAAALNRWKC